MAANDSLIQTKAEARRIARQAWVDWLRQPENGIAAGARLAAVLSQYHVDAVLAYFPMKDEWDPWPYLPEALPIFAPRCLDSGLEFRLVRSVGAPVCAPAPDRSGAPGAPEHAPLFDRHRSRPVAVLPALAAAVSGARLGRGAGYYDRSRALLLPALRIAVLPDELAGLAFPVEEHDLILDLAATEGGCRAFTSRGAALLATL